MSTRTLVGIAGGAIGAAIAGPKGAQLGWAIGSFALDSIFYPPKRAPTHSDDPVFLNHT